MKAYGERRYTPRYSYPQQQMEVSAHLHITVPLLRRASNTLWTKWRGGAQSRSGLREEEKIISPLPGTEPRFPRPPDVTRRYTD